MNEPYIPDLGLTYPKQFDAAMVVTKPGVPDTIDENYPFLDKSLIFRIRSAAVYLGIFILVFFLSPIRYGLKIEGRSILKKHRRLFKNGAMTVANHVMRWDFLFILQAVRFRRLWFPAKKENLRGCDGALIRASGGIPVPASIHLFKNFNRAFDELHAKKKWLHVFPESTLWNYYQPIRPFKKGMFYLACKYKIPVIPMAVCYRRPSAFFRIFKGKLPFVTLKVGEPIMPDAELPRREAALKLRVETHQKIVELAGIKNNPWPPEGD